MALWLVPEMLFGVFEAVAMALDTLPGIGRTLLLALLLSVALYGVARGIAQHPSATMQLYFRKAAIVVLVLVPVTVSLFGLQMPVYVEQAQHFSTPIPTLVSYVMAVLWGAGALWAWTRLWLQINSTTAALQSASDSLDKAVQQRVRHWQTRLNIDPGPAVLIGGSAHAWQVAGHIKLPTAARHWPVGQLDVLLLVQLAQHKQRCWLWLILSRLTVLLYWPLPWIAKLFQPMPELLVESAQPLARAAYRDPEGWRRDLHKLIDRDLTLADLEHPRWVVLASDLPHDVPDNAPIEARPRSWAATRKRRDDRYFDPYERVYWLVAVASVVVSVGSTLTIRQASPEFEPGFLDVRWQDQMGRRITDNYERQPADAADQQAAP